MTNPVDSSRCRWGKKKKTTRNTHRAVRNTYRSTRSIHRSADRAETSQAEVQREKRMKQRYMDSTQIGVLFD